jgi:predicted S18 family serine protease
MKIKRFNESLSRPKYDHTEKLLKVQISGEFLVPLSKIKETEAYYKIINKGYRQDYYSAIWYGIEEYAAERGESEFSWILVDGNGNVIEDEKEFDKQVEIIKKYNV